MVAGNSGGSKGCNAAVRWPAVVSPLNVGHQPPHLSTFRAHYDTGFSACMALTASISRLHVARSLSTTDMEQLARLPLTVKSQKYNTQGDLIIVAFFCCCIATIVTSLFYFIH